MSVKKRAASLILALGMLASTAPAFAADSTDISGDLAVQNSVAVSKNVAAQDYSYMALGASVKAAAQRRRSRDTSGSPRKQRYPSTTTLTASCSTNRIHT